MAFKTNLNAQSCASVTASYFGPLSTSSSDEYGARVTIAEIFTENITVVGKLVQTENHSNNIEFTLTIIAGQLSAETDPRYFTVPMASGLDIEITSVTPCPSDVIAETYLRDNFALLNVKAVKVADTLYVVQVTAQDFNTNDNSQINMFSLENDIFMDNGQGNDITANDGIYTSYDKYPTNVNSADTVIMQDKYLVDPSFKHMSSIQSKFGLGYSCDIHRCTCHECHCRACAYTWAPPWCFAIDNCSWTIGFDLF